MRIALTGAGGFVGINLTRRLAADGHEVLAVDRAFSQRSMAALPTGVTTREVDVLDAGTLQEALAAFQPQALFHGATLTADAARETAAFSSILDVNVVGTGRVLEAARAAGAARVVVASSSAVYGEAVFEDAPREDDRPSPTTLYGITKLAAEQAALRFASIHGVDVRVARIAAVFGPYEHRSGARDAMSPLFQLAASALAGEPAVLPQGGARDWIAAPRVADVLASLLTARSLDHAVYNVAAARTWTPDLLAQRLDDAKPGWSWSHGDRPTIDYRDDLTRRRFALDTTRLRSSFGEAAAGDVGVDAEDYVRWVRANPDWFT